jgi:hypothetical protein
MKYTKQQSLDAISRVLAYVAGRWYETEYGVLELSERRYQAAMHLLERHMWEVARG